MSGRSQSIYTVLRTCKFILLHFWSRIKNFLFVLFLKTFIINFSGYCVFSSQCLHTKLIGFFVVLFFGFPIVGWRHLLYACMYTNIYIELYLIEYEGIYVFAYINSCFVQIGKRRKKAKIKDIQNSIKNTIYKQCFFSVETYIYMYKPLNKKPFFAVERIYTYTYTNQFARQLSQCIFFGDCELFILARFILL